MADTKVWRTYRKRRTVYQDICQYHRDRKQLKLPGRQQHEVLGPTRAQQLESECLEPLFWMSHPGLRTHLRTPEVVAIGSAFHDAAVSYFDSGRLQMMGRFGLNAVIGLMFTHPDDVGLSYPLRIDPEAKVGAVKSMLSIIRLTTERILRSAVRGEVLRSKLKIFQDPAVIWAAAEHRVNVPASTLLHDLFGVSEAIPLEFDPMIQGEIDLAITRWLPEKKVLEISIEDYKTVPDRPDQKTIEHYRKSIQLPIYGALMDWAHLPTWEEMPEISIRLKYHFIWENGTCTEEVPYTRGIAAQALHRYLRFKPYFAKVREFQESHSPAEVFNQYFPALVGSYCPNCFAYGVCSLTRPTDQSMSYLDVVVPTKKSRKKVGGTQIAIGI